MYVTTTWLDETVIDTTLLDDQTSEAHVSPTGRTMPGASSSSQEISLTSLGHLIGTSRSRRESRIPVRFNDYVVQGKHNYGVEHTLNYSFLNNLNKYFVSNINKTIEPKSYEEASHDPNWGSSMNEEMEALHRNHTWDIIDLPKNRKPIGCQWMYKIKYNPNSEIE